MLQHSASFHADSTGGPAAAQIAQGPAISLIAPAQGDAAPSIALIAGPKPQAHAIVRSPDVRIDPAFSQALGLETVLILVLFAMLRGATRLRRLTS
jgi:hypothetical protein